MYKNPILVSFVTIFYSQTRFDYIKLQLLLLTMQQESSNNFKNIQRNLDDISPILCLREALANFSATQK